MSKLTDDLVLFSLVLMNASANHRGRPLRPDLKLHIRVHREADPLESRRGHLSHRGRRSAAVAPDESSLDEEAVILCGFLSNRIPDRCSHPLAGMRKLSPEGHLWLQNHQGRAVSCQFK